MTITATHFGRVKDGSKVTKFMVSNSRGLSFDVINYGGIITSLMMPDKRGNRANIVLSFDSLEEYINNSHYLGATIGRFANRIARGILIVAGKRYNLECNEEFTVHGRTVKNHLHGGVNGFNSVIWQAETMQTENSAGVRLSYISPDGEEGYPGKLIVTVEITLNEHNELKVDYQAETDSTTPVNLTNHSYWNLGGAGSGTILDHELKLECSNYLPIEATMIPTGEIRGVIGTAMDFTQAKRIGRDFSMVPGGYDHCFIVDFSNVELKQAARVYEPASGRAMEVLTTKPAIQFYTGNFLDDIHGAGGLVFNRHSGLCLETEHYPDAVNQPTFPQVMLQPGEYYHHKTVHHFSLVH